MYQCSAGRTNPMKDEEAPVSLFTSLTRITGTGPFPQPGLNDMLDTNNNIKHLQKNNNYKFFYVAHFYVFT